VNRQRSNNHTHWASHVEPHGTEARAQQHTHTHTPHILTAVMAGQQHVSASWDNNKKYYVLSVNE